MNDTQLKHKWTIKILEPINIKDAIAIVNTHDSRHGKLIQRDLEIHFSSNRLPGSYFVCATKNENGCVAGLMGLYNDPDPDVFDICWAVWLYVRPEFRGFGIGRMLIDNIETEASQRRARKLYLDIGNEQQHLEAINMYIKRGYVREGYFKDYFQNGEHKLIYAKCLVAAL